MIVRGTAADIAHRMQNDNLLEAGGHNMLVYDSLETLRHLFTSYAKTFLPRNEILLLATQYDTVDIIEHSLRSQDIDVSKHLDDGTLFIIDAQEGYQGVDSRGTYKLAMSLISRAMRERRRGVTWMGDMGSFFAFERMGDLVDYELFCPTKYEDTMKTVCCYNKADFGRLDKDSRDKLIGHHFKTIIAE